MNFVMIAKISNFLTFVRLKKYVDTFILQIFYCCIFLLAAVIQLNNRKIIEDCKKVANHFLIFVNRIRTVRKISHYYAKTERVIIFIPVELAKRGLRH